MNITETDRVIHSMMIENTGRHFLDSGDYLGRAWERHISILRGYQVFNR